MIHYILFWFSIYLCKTDAQNSYQIHDIPIEHYVHEDIQNDEIDVELMPRSPRFLPIDRNVPYDLNVQETRHIEKYFDELRNVKHDKKRTRRDASTKELIDKLGKPLELLVIESENMTAKPNESKEKEGMQFGDRFLINDFIRFKRSTTSKAHADESERKHAGGQFVQRIPEGSLIFPENLNKPKDITRETRGATKQQWVKQTLPVTDDNIYEDNLQLSSETVRAPRVHFVTNGMADRDPLEYKFTREPRSGPVNKYSPSDLSTEMDYYQPRFARNYVPRSRYTDMHYNRYPTDRRDYYRGQEYPDKTTNFNPDYNGNSKKRRIIYYATLPDGPRNSREDDLRRPYDRYYRDRYDDRYLDSGFQDNYRKQYYVPQRYDQERDPLYPIKVSTDVKVREVKKSPERRVYSDVDRTPYT